MIKKVLKVSLPVILIGLIVWNVYPKNNEFETKIQLDEIKKKAEEVAEKNNGDTDLDGLLDWEEELYKTDIENPDTDNDGVSDKDEVDQNRSPIIFGPGLEEDLKDLVRQKDFIQKSLDVPENLDDVKVSENVNSLSEFLQRTGYIKEIEDLKDSQTEKQEQIRSYLNLLASNILLASESSGTLNESLFSLYEGEANDTDKQSLRTLASRYQSIGQKIKDLDSPDFMTDGSSSVLSEKYLDLSEKFFKLINSSGSYGDNEFKKTADEYTKVVTERNTIFVDIYNFVKREKVYFGPNDPGRFFLFEVNGEF